MALLLVFPVAPSLTSGTWEAALAPPPRPPLLFRLCSVVPPVFVSCG